MQYIPHNFDYSAFDLTKVFLINTEQLSIPRWFEAMKQITNNIGIIDYSLANIKYLNDLDKNAHYLPYMVNRNEIYDYKKIYDFAIIGALIDNNSIRRKDIYNNLLKHKNVNISNIHGWYTERDEQLFQHKILLNIHYSSDYQIFEQFRCNRCILNKMIIITEKSEDINYKLKPYIIECDYDKFIETAIHVLDNYDYYYYKLFNNFNLDQIEKDYKVIGDKFMSTITTLPKPVVDVPEITMINA